MLLIALFLSFALANPSLEGTWTRPCENGKITYEIIQRNQAAFREDFFSDKSCQSYLLRFESQGDFILPKENPLAIDFRFDQVTLTLFTSELVEDFTRRQVCGLSSWSLSAPMPVTGLKCALFPGVKPMPVPVKDERRYGIYKIDDGRLYFGQNDLFYHGKTEDRRPINWDERAYILLPK
jgi:hypothetical protein